MKATNELKKEHNGIEVMLQILGAISEKLSRKETIPAKHLDEIIEFFVVFVDKCHHGKEEEFLFPALEAAGVDNQNGPIGVMLAEHEQGRRMIAKLKDAVSEYSAGEEAAAIKISGISNHYIELLTQHIAKENRVLFPMADSRLAPDKDNTLFDAFEQLEKDRIGPGKHEAFHVLLEQLRTTYL